MECVSNKDTKNIQLVHSLAILIWNYSLNTVFDLLNKRDFTVLLSVQHYQTLTFCWQIINLNHPKPFKGGAGQYMGY